MKPINCVYIATSIDGYIADREGKIDWLNKIAIPEGTDMGYEKLMSQTDAIVMGRNTFKTVCAFDIEWPYQIPTFVLSSTLKEVPENLKEKVFLVNGPPTQVIRQIHSKGYHSLYIDGGLTIQAFLKEDLIDEMIITTIPVLLGGGIPLFSELASPAWFECVEAKLFMDKIVQNKYRRVKGSL